MSHYETEGTKAHVNRTLNQTKFHFLINVLYGYYIYFGLASIISIHIPEKKDDDAIVWVLIFTHNVRMTILLDGNAMTVQ